MNIEDDATLSLYGTTTCPYCVFVLRALEPLDLDVPFRDTTDPEHRRALVEGTKRTQVPVLRIDTAAGTRWMPESVDIVRYLKQRAGASSGRGGEVAVQVLGAGAIACLIFGFAFPAAKLPLWGAAAAALATRAFLRWRV